MITLRNLVDAAMQAIEKSGHFEKGNLSKATTEKELLFYIGRFIALMHHESGTQITQEVNRQYTLMNEAPNTIFTEQTVVDYTQQAVDAADKSLIHMLTHGIFLFQKALNAKFIDPATTNLPLACAIIMMILSKGMTDMPYDNKSFAKIFGGDEKIINKIEWGIFIKLVSIYTGMEIYRKNDYSLDEPWKSLLSTNEVIQPTSIETLRNFAAPYGNSFSIDYDQNATITYSRTFAYRILCAEKSKILFNEALKSPVNRINTLIEFSSHEILNNPVNIENFLNGNPEIMISEKNSAEIFFNALLTRLNVLLKKFSNANFLTELPGFLSAIDAVKQTIPNDSEKQSHFQIGFLNFYSKVIASISSHVSFTARSGLPPKAYTEFFKSCDEKAVARDTVNICLQNASPIIQRYAGEYISSIVLSNFVNTLNNLNAIRAALDDTNVLRHLLVNFLPSFTVNSQQFFREFFNKIIATSNRIVQDALQNINNFDTILDQLNEIHYIGKKLHSKIFCYRLAISPLPAEFDTELSAQSIQSLINTLYPLLINAVQAHLNNFQGPQKTAEITSMLARANATNRVFAQKLAAVIQPPQQQLMLSSQPAFHIASDLPELFPMLTTMSYGHNANTPSPKKQKIH